MDTDVQTLQDLFKIGYEAYEESRKEAAEIVNMFHNRQYTQGQIDTLKNRGQPQETFNVIKLFGRLLLGYYSTVVNSVKASPVQIKDTLTASLLNDIISYELRTNHFETEGDKIKLDGLLQGIMCSYVDVEGTGQFDEFGREMRKIRITHTPADEIVLDPMSTLEDYSDARWLHRFKWLSEERLLKTLYKYMSKKKAKELVANLDDYYNHLDIDEAEFDRKYNIQFDGYFKRFNNYLVVNTVIEDDDDRVWSIFWSGDVELYRTEVTYKEVKFPYRVHKIHTSDKTEYYGIFREVVESQKAINQALLKIQLMANTQKIFVEKGGVENLHKFADMVNRINAIIPVEKLSKIRVENLTKDIVDQYTIIDRGFDRIQRVLGVNDSFLGMAFASDSGRKVKLQQNATSLALRYVSVRIEQFYRLLGWDVANLVKQYYTATQAWLVSDDYVGDRWITANQPMQQWTGQFDANGQPIMELVYDEVLDPATGEPELDENGNIIIAPVPTEETDIAFTKVDISIDTVIYNDEDEKNQLMLETMLSGNIGNVLLQMNPAGYLRAAALSVKSMKTKRSLEIGEIIDQTAAMLMQSQQAVSETNAPPEGMQSNSRKSSSAKLPQNTNEGA